MKMITTKAHRRHGKAMQPGDKFEAEGQDRRLTEALGWGREADPEIEPLARVWPPREGEAAAAPRAPAAKKVAAKKAATEKAGSYRTRHLTAEAPKDVETKAAEPSDESPADE